AFMPGVSLFLGLLFLADLMLVSAVSAGYLLIHVWSNADRILEFDLAHMGWRELLALASIPAGVMALYSMYTAYERWRIWAHHGHHCDPALTAPEPRETIAFHS